MIIFLIGIVAFIFIGLAFILGQKINSINYNNKIRRRIREQYKLKNKAEEYENKIKDAKNISDYLNITDDILHNRADSD